MTASKTDKKPLYCFAILCLLLQAWQPQPALAQYQNNHQWTEHYIDKTGKFVSLPEESPVLIREGLECFTTNDNPARYGFRDRNHKVVIPAHYECAWDFFNGLARVVIGKQEYFIDKKGKIVLTPKYNCSDFINDRALVLGPQRFYIDRHGRQINKAFFDDGRDFSEGLAAVQIGGKWGFIDPSCRVVISPKFEQAGDFAEGMCVIQLNGQWGYIDKAGKIIIRPQFGNAREFHEGLAAASVGNKKGFIDRTGKMVIPPQFDTTYRFSEGLAAVEMSCPFHEGVITKYGYIDTEGKWVIKPTFRFATEFSGGKAFVLAFNPLDLLPPKPLSLVPKLDNRKWLGKILANPYSETSMYFKSATEMVIRYDHKTITAHYVMKPINPDDPGLDGMIFAPETRLEIYLEDGEKMKRSLWAMEFSGDRIYDAYKLYRDSPPDPWGASIQSNPPPGR